MRSWINISVILILASAIIVPGYAKEASAEDVAAFYKGKVLTFIVTKTPGGGYDTHARVLAPILEKYTGATVVVRNMPGGGDLVALNHLYNTAKKDGTVMAIIPGSSTIGYHFLGVKAAKFDLAGFKWLGRPAWDRTVWCVGASSPLKSVDDVRSAKQYRHAATARYSESGFRGALISEALGLTNTKMISGYGGSSETKLAVIRGEAHGCAFSAGSVLELVEEGDAIALATLDHEREPMFPDVPTIYEVGVLKQGKEWMDWWVKIEKVGRSLIVPPGVPQARLQFLREAIMKSFRDKDYLARIKKTRRPIDPISGEQVSKLVQSVMGLSREKSAELKHLVGKKYYK